MPFNYREVVFVMPGCFVLWMDKFLPQCVGRFKVNRDMTFIKDPPVFLRSAMCCVSRLLLCVCSGSFSGFDKGPVFVATGLKC